MFRQGDPSEKISHTEFFTRFFGLPAIVTPFSYLFEIAVTQSQFGKRILDGYRGNTQLGTGIYYAYQQSLIKGGTFATREPIGESFESILGAKARLKEEEALTGTSWGRTTLANFGLPTLITGVDTITTQYAANRRAQAAMKMVVPPYNTTMDFFRYSVQSYTPRWLRNFLGFNFLMATKPLVKKPLENIFPQAGFANDFFSYSFVGSLSNLVGTPCDKIWKVGLKEMNFNNFTTPKMREVTKLIYTTEGMRGFFRGSYANMLSGAALFAMVGAVEYGMDNYLFPKKKTTMLADTPLAPRLFAQKPTVEIVELREQKEPFCRSPKC